MSPRSRTFWRAEPPFRRKRRGARAFAPAPRSRTPGASGLLRPRPARVLPVLLAHGLGENVDAAFQPCRALLLRTGRVRFPALWWGSGRGGVCAGPCPVSRRCFRSGRSALGQVTVHWGRLLTCPNGCFRAPMRIPRSERSGVPDWAVAEEASARSRSLRRAWEGAAVEDKATVGSVLTAIAPAGPPAVLRQGVCRAGCHSDTVSVTRPSEGPVPIGARFHSDTNTAGSVFTAIPTRRAPFSQWCPWFHSGAPGFTAIPRRKCYSALGLLISSATVRRRVGGPWVTEGGGGQRRRQPLSAGPRRLELVAPPGCGNRHRCPILSRACC